MLEGIERLWAAAQRVRAIAEKFKEADMKLAVADLMNTVADLKAERAQQQEENTELRRQLRETQQRLTVRRGVVFRDGFYYLAKPKPGLSAGPFCPTCYEEKSCLLTLRHRHVLEMSGRKRRTPDWYCPSCRRRFSCES